MSHWHEISTFPFLGGRVHRKSLLLASSFPILKWNARFWIMFNFWWSAGLVNGLDPHLPPLSSQKMKCSFLDYIQLLMISRAGQWTQTPSAIPLQPKRETLIFGLRSTSDDWLSNPSMKVDWNVTKGPLSHWTMKCSFLDYIQLLMIGHAIQATKVNWNAEKGPLSHWKMKYSFLYYIQLLMIGQAIRVMKVDQNAKKWNVVSVRVFCCFSLGLLYPPSLRWQGRN